jgi:hypothetical protein
VILVYGVSVVDDVIARFHGINLTHVPYFTDRDFELTVRHGFCVNLFNALIEFESRYHLNDSIHSPTAVLASSHDMPKRFSTYDGEAHMLVI